MSVREIVPPDIIPKPGFCKECEGPLVHYDLDTTGNVAICEKCGLAFYYNSDGEEEDEPE